jgi:hypothetical protein
LYRIIYLLKIKITIIMTKNIKITLVVILVIATLGLFFPRGKTAVQTVVERVGGASGTTHTNLETFESGLGVGGTYATSTSGAQMPLLSTAIENVSTIVATLNVLDTTLTFPASSTIQFMRGSGDTRVYWVKNATTTAAMDITFAAGTGMNLKNATSTKILIGDTDGGNAARVTLIRQADSDIDMYVDLFVEEQ